MAVPVSVENALHIVLSHTPTLPAEEVELTRVLGRTLAGDLKSDADIPPFDNSSMDGFAVLAGDIRELPAILPVIEVIPAGSFPEKEIVSGTCSRIMTGAPIPQGADAVIPVEWTHDREPSHATITRRPEIGQNIRRAGEDVHRGQTVLRAGSVITPPAVGMLASIGTATVIVCRQPRVAVVATGDELIEPEETPSAGRIRNSNGPALAAQVKSAGGIPLVPGIARDNRESADRILREASDADVVLISGGVSVGDYDIIRAVLDDLGMELLFWKVRQRPGKPLAFGTLDGKPVFGLPGNPVSSAVCFEQYVRPALAQMLGRLEIRRQRCSATLAQAIKKKKGLHYFARGIASYDTSGRLEVGSTGAQGSGIYSSMVEANCLIHLPEDLEDPVLGTAVEIEWLCW